MDTDGSLRTLGAHELLVHGLGKKRDHGRKLPVDGNKTLPQRLVSAIRIVIVLVLPEPPAAASQIPARKPFYKAHHS
jgi:hypothetical protein